MIVSDYALPIHAVAFIERLIALKSSPVAIWLIGSRANGRANDDSDTDLLIFGCSKFLSVVKHELQRPRNIDCLVAVGAEEFKDPWSEKSLSLSELKWSATDDMTATYTGIKSILDEEDSLDFGEDFAEDCGRVIRLQECAFRIWPVSTRDIQL
jgi:predicted nucleotidyltransferase